MVTKLIISGSPRRDGKSSRLAEALLRRCQEEDPQASVLYFSLADQQVEPCTACDSCADDYRCIIEDDMQGLYEWVEVADELIIVSPVFFAGPPAQMKALLDRLQPYFWRKLDEKAAGTPPREKRPASLFVIGEGGDPHGFSPLIISTRSAIAVAGFLLDTVFNCVGLNASMLNDVVNDPVKYRFDSSYSATLSKGKSNDTAAGEATAIQKDIEIRDSSTHE